MRTVKGDSEQRFTDGVSVHIRTGLVVVEGECRPGSVSSGLPTERRESQR